MKFRRWDRGGWSVAVGVPDAVAERAREFVARSWGPLGRSLRAISAGSSPKGSTLHRDERGRSLVLSAPPPIRTVKRDPLASVEAFVAHAPAQVSDDGAGLAAAIAEERWYHTIELPDGTVTDGRFDHRPLVPHYGLPASMTGMRALDVGTADGFWAFEMERRGADVVALELPRMSDRDFPASATPYVRERFDTPPGRRFELARQALGSNVKLIRSRVYDIDPSTCGTFDFVHIGDVLLHLRDPAGALAAIRSVTSGQAHIADVVEPRDMAGIPGMNLVAYHGGWEATTWWIPSPNAIAQMTVDAGFGHVEVLRLYRLDMPHRQGVWRAILRARP